MKRKKKHLKGEKMPLAIKKQYLGMMKPLPGHPKDAWVKFFTEKRESREVRVNES